MKLLNELMSNNNKNMQFKTNSFGTALDKTKEALSKGN